MGNETYLKALYKYGPYLENAQEYLSDAFFDSKNSLEKGEPLEYYCTAIEDAIVKYCYLGGKYYRHDAPPRPLSRKRTIQRTHLCCLPPCAEGCRPRHRRT